MQARIDAMRRPGSGWLALALVLLAGLVFVGRPLDAEAVPRTQPEARFWQANGRVLEIVETDDAIYLAGRFTELIGPQGQRVTRNRIAALDPDSGAPLAFNPNANAEVWALDVSADGDTLYAGGDFTSVGGVGRQRAAAIATDTGGVRAWNPRADSRVKAIAVVPGRVVLGGRFATLGGVSRPNLGAVNSTTGALQTDWTRTTNGIVHDLALAPDGSRLLVGGDFGSVSGTPAGSQRRIASLDPETGDVQPWVSHPNFEFFDLDVSSNRLFAAAGGSGGHAVAWDLATGQQQWVGFGDGDAVAIAHQNGAVYIGGHFNRWLGESARHIVVMDAASGSRVPWPVALNSALGTWSIDSHRGHLSVGGDFTTVNGAARARFARFTESVDDEPPTVPGRPSGSVDGPTSVRLTWAGSVDNAASSITYHVYRDGNAVGTVTVPEGQPVEFVDESLQPGSTHTWTVRASDGVNTSAPSQSSAPVTLPASNAPVMSSMTMHDQDTDGRVDQLVAEFSAPVSCPAPCTSPWSLQNVPSGGRLGSVQVAGDRVTLQLTEGTGSMSTAVGSFRVALAGGPAGVVDDDGDAASFGPTAPDDRAGPVPRDLTSTNGSRNNVMETGDTFTVTFSEPLDPSTVIAANVKQYDPAGAGNDEMIVVGLTDDPINLQSNDFVLPDGGTAVFQNSTLTMLSGNTKVRSTIVAPCSGTACGQLGPGAERAITFRPEPFIKDSDGNQATGARTESEGIF